ncbi:uncharacterized protein LOC126836675 [Adelges cooleyi]|uniref:uncharacterized protein LOC126836675 n=1 Tax=Adelges cooleyi TaxID=133065 RepID=UPI00217FC406|nr:uncharacterized protein LOC126836675 [Adelges cooleyi]
MTANICTFMLCCFVITSNINTIESAKNNKINPIRFFIHTSREIYIRTLNNLKTFNKHPIVIKQEDQVILSTPGVGNITEYHLKLKSRDKLEKKAEDIKCSYSVVAKSNISYLKSLVENLKSGEPFIKTYEDTIKSIKKEAEIIFHLLMFGNLETGKWLWHYFLKIVAIRKYNVNKPFIDENLFEDGQLQSGVSDVIDNCMAENYLPPATMESNFISKNRSTFDNMISDLCNSGWLIGIIFDRDYDALIEFLYLKPFWDDSGLLFRQMKEVDIDWSETKQRFELEMVITKEFVANRIWMYHPYGRLDHQYLLVKIIDARIYCYLTVVLCVYETQLSSLDKEALTNIKDVIYKLIVEVLKLTAFKDELLVAISSEVRYGKITDFDDVQDILARVRAKANGILDDLNGTGTRGTDRFSFDIDKQQLTSIDLITGIIKEFRDYLTEFRGRLTFHYKTLLHFMDLVKTAAAPYI